MRKPAVLFFVSIAFTLLSATSSSAQPLTGRVVDPSGDPVPRAYVRVLDAGGKTTAGSFTEADGRFRLEATDSELHPTAHKPRGGGPGLHPTAHKPRGGGPGLPRRGPARGVRDRGRALRRRADRSQADARARARSDRGIGDAKRGAREPARGERHGVRRLGSGAAAVAGGRRSADRLAGRDHRADRRIRERHVALRARRRERLQQGADRRDPGQRAGGLLQLQQHHEREPRTRGDRPRRTVRALRLGRDGQRDPARHAPRPRRIGAASRRRGRRRDVRHRTRARGDRGRVRPRGLLGGRSLVHDRQSGGQQPVREHDAVGNRGRAARRRRLDSRRGARRARQVRRSRCDRVRPRRHRRVLPAPRRGRRRDLSAGSRIRLHAIAPPTPCP